MSPKPCAACVLQERLAAFAGRRGSTRREERGRVFIVAGVFPSAGPWSGRTPSSADQTPYSPERYKSALRWRYFEVSETEYRLAVRVLLPLAGALCLHRGILHRARHN